jgi:thymidylate synthase ThyX
MAFGARILADSISEAGARLTTFEVTIPRIVLAEFNTHRMLSRNSASSRAIPVDKMISLVVDDPYIPTHWGRNQRGMQAGEEVSAPVQFDCELDWLQARNCAVQQARILLERGIHKQITNRLLEPFLWHTVIVTATEWDNFFHLRNHPDAHPDIQVPAAMMQELLENNEPQWLDYGQWHLPLIQPDEWHFFRYREPDRADLKPTSWDEAVKISVGRCARVSYLTHDGKRDPQADIELYERLLKSGHMSPFEHVGRPAEPDDWKVPGRDGLLSSQRGQRCIRYAPDLVVKDVGDGPYAWLAPELQWHGNFRGWVQHRKLISGEADILGHRQAQEP